MAEPATKKPSAVRRVLRAVKRLLLVVLLLAVVAAGVALIVIHTDWGRNKIKSEIEAQLVKQFPGGATIGALEGSVLGTFTLRDLAINSIDGKPAITIREIEANLGLTALARKTAEIEKLAIDGLKIVAGGAPLTKPSEPSPDDDGEPGTWSVQLPDIALTRGTIEALGPDGKEVLALDDLAFNGEVRIPAGKPIVVRVLDGGKATWREKKLPIKLRARVSLGKTIEIERGRFSVGDMEIRAEQFIVDPDQPIGHAEIKASSAAIAAVAPEVDLPGDVKVSIDLAAAPKGMQLTVNGTIGLIEVHSSLQGDPAKRVAAGVITLGDIDLTKLGIKDLPQGTGDIALAVDVDRKGVRGILGTRGTALDMPAADATVLIDTTWKDAKATVLMTGEGDTRFAATAYAKRGDDKTITLDRAQFVAFARDLAKPTANRVRVATLGGEGRLEGKLDRPAVLAPKLDATFSGTVRASRVRADDLSVAAVDASFRGTVVDTKVVGRARADVRGAVNARTPLGSAVVDAEYLADGRIWSRIDAKPAAAPVGVKVTSYVTLGDIVKVALTDHAIAPPTGAPWIGKTGTILIDTTKPDPEITVKDFVTGNGAGRATVAAKVVGSTLDASLDASQLPASAIDATYRGSISGKLAIKKRGLRWDGGGDLVASGLLVDPTAPAFDGDVHVAIAGRTVKLDAKARNADIGGARFEIDVEGPRDITDVAAWRRLERTAIRTATVTVDKVQLATVSPTTGGAVNGKLAIGATTVEGSLEVKQVQTPLGFAEGIVTFAPIAGDLYASWNANLSDVGEANIGMRVAFPKYLFDPLAWQQLGRGVARSLTASFDDIAIDPAKLAKLGVDAPYTARADVQLAVGAGASTAQLDVKVRSITGGVLTKPVDVKIEASTDGNGTRANACVARATDPKTDACSKGGSLKDAVATVPRLLEIVDLETAVTFSTWLSAPQTAVTAALSGRVVIPKQSAPDYLALVGRNDFDPKRGTTEGEIVLGGILGRPTANGQIVAGDLQLLSTVVGRNIPVLQQLKIEPRWNGTTGRVEISAIESNGGKLNIEVSGAPDRLSQGRADLVATKLDLAPLAAFLPGELAASKGMLDGWVKATGLDLDTSKLEANVQLSQGEVPIHPIAGTLRNANLDLLVGDKGITLDARGLLNSCRDPNNPRCTENVKLTATAPPDVSKIDGTLVATKVSTLGEIEPIIDGTAKIELVRRGGELTGNIYLRNGHISVPQSTGDDLLAAEMPDDLYFVEKPPKQLRFKEARTPTKTWFDARIHIEPTSIDIDEYGGNKIGVKASIVTRRPLRLKLGDAVGLEGKIAIEYGSADDIFGRRYEIEPTELVTFDGTIDPIIDLKLTHRFPDLTLIAKVQGRPSEDDFPHATFEADPPGRYNESELFAFFLGGEPGGAIASQSADAAKAAGSALVSQKLGKQLKKLLPERLQLDVIACEVGTSTGGSCTLGKRVLNNKGFIAWKHRLTPLPNENAEEVLGQYYFGPSLFFEGTGGSSNITGADLILRKRW